MTLAPALSQREREEDSRPGMGLPSQNPGERIRRQTVEFLLLLGVGILLLRTFAAEAYVVPTGSMAPTLLGFHKELTCPNCRFPVRARHRRPGSDRPADLPQLRQAGRVAETSRPSSATAIACSSRSSSSMSAGPGAGRSRSSRAPAEPDQAYVKRVVGLPWRDDPGLSTATSTSTARSPASRSRSSGPCASWSSTTTSCRATPTATLGGGSGSTGPVGRILPSGWRAEGSTRFIHATTGRESSANRLDWLEYRPLTTPTARDYGPVRDFCPYNGGDIRGDNVVTRPGMVEAERLAPSRTSSR